MSIERLIGILLLACTLTACTPSPADQQAQIAYEQGKALRQQGKPVEAMNAFLHALRVGSNNHALLGRVYSNMANMCRQAEQHDLAYEVYTRSAEHFALADNPLAYAYALNNMAWEQAVSGHKDTAMTLVDAALSACDSVAVLHKVAETQAAACLYACEYDSALRYAAGIHDTLYRAILCAQAYTFLGLCDSAILYAQQVTGNTTNPRYLDDAYYILVHCDSAVALTDILSLTSSRADVQRELQQQKADLAQAIYIMLHEPDTVHRPIYHVLLWVGVLLSIGGCWFLLSRHRKQCKTPLRQTCHALRRSADLRNELQWDNYPQWCAVCDERLAGIVTKLQQRGLSEREIRICVLVLIGLSYSEMAAILYRAESGIGKDKYTIAKKLNTDVKGLQETLLNIAEHNNR